MSPLILHRISLLGKNSARQSYWVLQNGMNVIWTRLHGNLSYMAHELDTDTDTFEHLET